MSGKEKKPKHPVAITIVGLIAVITALVYFLRGFLLLESMSFYEKGIAGPVFQGYALTETGAQFWKDRYKSINNFEDHLTRNGIVVLKIFVNISREEQKKRMLEIIGDPTQRWSFSPAALSEWKAWDRYVEAYEETISATSTERAPWYVIPADHRWVANAMVADILTDVILELGVDYPKLPEEKLKDLQAVKEKLENEVE